MTRSDVRLSFLSPFTPHIPFGLSQFFDLVVNLVMIDVKRQEKKRGNSRQNDQGLVLVVKRLCALEASHQRPWNSSDRRDKKEDAPPHGGQAEDVTQGIFWKPRDEKEEKTEDSSFVANQVIELFPRLG